MPKVWNLGNVTVRNPNRIEFGLSLFASEFQGNIYGKKQEAAFIKRLREENIIESSGKNSAWFGRKWRSCFVKLGFATNGKNKLIIDELKLRKPELGLKGLIYELTPAGNRLINAQSTAEIHDVYLRQLVRHEIPSCLEPSFRGGKLKPFIYILQVLHGLHAINEAGLNKIEAAIFLQLFQDHDAALIGNTIDKILEYRRQLASLRTVQEKRRFEARLLKQSGTSGNIKEESLRDYADTTFRYVLMTGVLAHEGKRLVIRDDKAQLVESILSAEPQFLSDADKYEYLADYYHGTRLPTDDAMFSIAEIQRLNSNLTEVGRAPEVDLHAVAATTDIATLDGIRYKLQEDLLLAKEEQYAVQQSSDDSVNEILKYLDAIQSARKCRDMDIYDKAAYLEWIIWRAFLAIDRITQPIHSTRRFPIDEDILPRHHAPAGDADMAFEFDEFTLVVEVTLLTTSRQEAAEGEPVRRHVAGIKKSSDKPVYGLFIAPEININTASTFRDADWYDEDSERIDLDIVPMTIKQFITIVTKYLDYKFTPSDIRNLVQTCLEQKGDSPSAWQRNIDSVTRGWIARFN